MNNKQQIQKLRNNAELGMAAYGYFNLIGKRFEKKILKDIGRESTPIITQIDILDSTYKGYIVMGKDCWEQDIELGTLKGDFSPTQVKRFFDKYDLLDFYPKFDTKNNKQKEGFHACLFQDKESKELIRKLN